ncbi:MAG: hypothetical protein NUV46_00945 [Nanoarchaeota archaeon]|nr:hypothetical protein [Nanoarchaeota archaeon]
MTNFEYNRLNYRNTPLNFYVNPFTMKYLLEKFESDGNNKNYKFNSAWNEIMDMQRSTYEDYSNGKKKKKRYN